MLSRASSSPKKKQKKAKPKKSTGPHQKARVDIFTVQLALALVAILVGIVFMYLENEMYNWDRDARPSVPAGPAVVQTVAPDAWPPFTTPALSKDAPSTAPLFPV